MRLRPAPAPWRVSRACAAPPHGMRTGSRSRELPGAPRQHPRTAYACGGAAERRGWSPRAHLAGAGVPDEQLAALECGGKEVAPGVPGAAHAARAGAVRAVHAHLPLRRPLARRVARVHLHHVVVPERHQVPPVRVLGAAVHRYRLPARQRRPHVTAPHRSEHHTIARSERRLGVSRRAPTECVG